MWTLHYRCEECTPLYKNVHTLEHLHLSKQHKKNSGSYFALQLLYIIQPKSLFSELLLFVVNVPILGLFPKIRPAWTKFGGKKYSIQAHKKALNFKNSFTFLNFKYFDSYFLNVMLSLHWKGNFSLIHCAWPEGILGAKLYSNWSVKSEITKHGSKVFIEKRKLNIISNNIIP